MNKHSFNFTELVISILVFALLAAVLLPAFSRARIESRITACRTNLERIGSAIDLYSRNYRSYPDAFPRPLEKDLVHAPGVFHCPAGGGYGFSAKLLGSRPGEAAWDDILVADSDTAVFTIGEATPPDIDRHSDSAGRVGFNALRVDGSVKFIPTPQISQ